MSERQHVICWDMDGTLGNLHAVLYNIEGQPLPEWEKPLSIRYGMEELLTEFSPANGFVNYVTTSASDENGYVSQAIQALGLTSQFREIFSRNVISRGYGKLYTPVKTAAEVKDHQAQMIAIGDSPGDAPADLNGMIFMDLSGGHNLEALVIREVIVALLEAGEGNFRRGFDNLYNAIEGGSDIRTEFQGLTYTLPNGITFFMQMREINPYDNHSLKTGEAPYPTEPILHIPTIYFIEAPEAYQKPFRRL